jgi:hypothetical protein
MDSAPMGYVLAILFVVAVSFVGRAIERRARERRELRWFSWGDDSWEGIIDSWDFDLVEMSLRTTLSQAGVPDRERRYELVRNASGWWMRFTYESYEAEVRQLLAWIDGDYMLSKETLRERLRELDNGPAWWPVPPAAAGPLESQYQRFLLHYRP